MKIGIGQPRTGKTDLLKKEIKISKKKVIVFDFYGDFKDVDGVRFDFELFHPLIDALSLEEVKVLNAGYLKNSHCLYRQAEDILNFEGLKEMKGIVRDSIERLHASWEESENKFAKELTERIPFKIHSKQKSFSELIEIIKENQCVVLTANNIFSDHLRSLIYLLLYKLEKEELATEIYADGITNMLFKGNTKLFSQVVNLNNVDLILNSNKPSNIPLDLIPKVKEWRFFKNTDKTEINFVEKHITKKKINFKNLPIGSFEKINC